MTYIWGAGPQPADIMLVGERPGEQEYTHGIPFIGPSGREQERYLLKAGITEAFCYKTNLVKDFIQGNPKVDLDTNSTDLGDDIQVRAVGHPNGELILRPADQKYGRMAHRFVLIHAHKNPTKYTVIGWTYGINALAKKSYWQNKDNGRPPAWFIPQEDLFDMATWEKD